MFVLLVSWYLGFCRCFVLGRHIFFWFLCLLCFGSFVLVLDIMTWKGHTCSSSQETLEYRAVKSLWGISGLIEIKTFWTRAFCLQNYGGWTTGDTKEEDHRYFPKFYILKQSSSYLHFFSLKTKKKDTKVGKCLWPS